MSTYIVLERINVQNANCIAGYTWGFPAITHFLGFTHNLSRKMGLQNNQQLRFNGCGVVCHQQQVHAYRHKTGADYRFIQWKNPVTTKKQASELNSKGKNPPIIEEGKMHFTASLLLECQGQIIGGEAGNKQFEADLENMCYQQKLAGGSINSVKTITIHSASTEKEYDKMTRQIKKILLPGFILMDRSDLLEAHFESLKSENEDVGLVDAWLDFSSIKYKARPILKNNETEPTEKTDAVWEIIPKPGIGWLVPIMTGYKAISDVYPPGEVGNVRDSNVPVCFVESVHSIGEWYGVHKLKNISDCIWRYVHDNEWYVCRQTVTNKIPEENQQATDDIESFLSTL